MSGTGSGTGPGPGPGSVSRARAVPALVVSALLAACGAAAFHRVLAGPDLLPVAAVAAGGPALLVGLVGLVSVGRRRYSLWFSGALSVLAWLLVVSATVLRAGAIQGVLPSAATLAGIGTGLRDGWLQMLGTILPAPATPQLLLAIHALVWLTSYVAAELVARTRAAVLPVLPPLFTFATGVLFGVTGPGANLAVIAGFVALAAVLLVIRQSTETGTVASGYPALRRYAGAVPVLASVVLVATLLGPRLPGLTGREPFDLRRHVTPVGQPHTAVNPLNQVSAWLATPDLVLFTVTATSSADWRIAALDEFDGQTWRTSGQFVPTDQRVPAPAASPAKRSRLDQDVTIAGLTGDWLPAAEAPTTIRGTSALVDPGTGVLLSQSGLRTGLRYTVVSQVPEYDEAQLRRAVPASDAGARAALVLPPGLPDSIAAEAQRATAGASFPFQQATRLENYLRSTGKNDPSSAVPGHAYGHLAYFLGASHRGTTEQFATAFAVLARSLGLPTRVVVGFGPGQRTPAGTWAVRGRDTLVWPEVDFAGLGWVPFYPTPHAGSAADGATATPAGATSQRQEVDARLDAAPTTGVQSPAPPANRSNRTGSGAGPSRAWWWLIPLVPAGLATGYLTAVLLVPWLRSRRRRAVTGGTAQVAAAWVEATARLAPLRLGGLRALATDEVATVAGRRLTASAHQHLHALAALADAAVFSGIPLDDAAGAAAWRHVDALRRPVRQAVGRRAALRHRLSPAMLIR